MPERLATGRETGVGLNTDCGPSPVLRIVFDTNVLLSLQVFARSPAGSRLQALQSLLDRGQVQALTREDCLAEFVRVLGYPEFALAPARQREIYSAYEQQAVRWEADAGAQQHEVMPLPRCKDADDQKFLELARDARADCLLTSDKALLKLARHRRIRERFRILAPETLLQELQAARTRT